MNKRPAVLALFTTSVLVIGASAWQSPLVPAGASVSTGFAASLTPVLTTAGCTNPKVSVQPDVFPIRVGTVKSSDEKEWTVPGPVADGDGGFIAYFSDGNGTHADWRAETFYIAPLDDPMCVRTAGGRDSSFCAQAVRPACA